MNIKKIKHWLRSNEFDCDVVKSDYFGYGYHEETIYAAKELFECDHIEFYLDYIKKLGYEGDYDLKTLCFLHELGHSQTMDELPEWCFTLDKLKKFLETPSKNKVSLWIKSFFYFRLPVEKAATKWAVEFIRDYPEEVEELDKIWQVKKI